MRFLQPLLKVRSLGIRVLQLPPIAYGIGYVAAIPLFAVIYSLLPAQFTPNVENQAHFVRALYFSAITITTVGFGDIVPLSNVARSLVASEALGGILLIGLFLNSLARVVSEREFKLLENKRRVRLCRGLIESLQFNKERAQQARDKLRGDGMPNFPMDADRLAHLVTESFGCVDDEILRAIEWHRFQLAHITQKILVMNTFYLLNTFSDESNRLKSDAYMTALRDSMLEHFDIVINGTESLVASLREIEIAP